MNEYKLHQYINKINHLWSKTKKTAISIYWIIFYFFLITMLSTILSYFIMTYVFNIDLNINVLYNFNILKYLLFLIMNTFLVFILSALFNLIYIRFNKNEWVYTVINALLLVMVSSVIFLVLGLNTTIETYVVNEFKIFVSKNNFENIYLEDAIYIVKAIYNMFIYWLSSTIITYQIAFTLVNNYRERS